MKDKEKARCKKNGVNGTVESVIGNDGLTLSYSMDARRVHFTKEQLQLELAAHTGVDGK